MSFGFARLAVFFVVGLSHIQANTDDIVVGQTFLADSTDPRTGSTAWSLTSHGISEKLFTVDEEGDIVGQVAKSVSKVSEKVWQVKLKAGYKFSDGTSVTPQHVADCLNELNKVNDNAKASLGTMTVTPITSDSTDLLVNIESETATHVMDAVLAEWVFVVYLKDSEGNFVFTGPYAVKSFSDSKIDLKPNTHYPQADERPMVTIKKFADGNALAAAVEKKEVDVGFHLPVGELSELRKVDGIHIKSFEVGYHYMALYNIARMPDLKVRKAIDVAIDRKALSQALKGGHGTRSLFPDYTPYHSDDSSMHGDSTKAKELLDEAGWTLTNGKRTKDGQILNVHLVAYPHRPGLGTMQPVIAEALTALGITVTSTLTGQDWSETQKIIDDASFDLLMWAQNTLPAGDPGWFLHSFFRSDGSNNHAGLKSTTVVDPLLDELLLKEVHTERVAATKAAQTAILAEVPVSNLVTPEWHVSLSDRVSDYKPWGSDYYIIRADMFVASTPTVASTESSSAASIVLSSSLLAILAIVSCSNVL